jgi:hypothetical protein
MRLCAEKTRVVAGLKCFISSCFWVAKSWPSNSIRRLTPLLHQVFSKGSGLGKVARTGCVLGTSQEPALCSGQFLNLKAVFSYKRAELSFVFLLNLSSFDYLISAHYLNVLARL